MSMTLKAFLHPENVEMLSGYMLSERLERRSGRKSVAWSFVLGDGKSGVGHARPREGNQLWTACHVTQRSVSGGLCSRRALRGAYMLQSYCFTIVGNRKY